MDGWFTKTLETAICLPLKELDNYFPVRQVDKIMALKAAFFSNHLK